MPAMMTSVKHVETALRAVGVSKAFGGLRAVRGVDLQVAEGSFHAVIGPNGAGKSTLLGLLARAVPLDGGEVYAWGVNISAVPAHSMIKVGVGRSFQTTNLFHELSVGENIRLAAFKAHSVGIDRRWRRIVEYGRIHDLYSVSVERTLQRIGLISQREKLAASLSHGDKRRLEIGILLAQDSRLLLLDEPTAGLASEQIPDIASLLREIHREGRTILLIEHNMDVVMSLSDTVSVMHQGEMIAEGSPTEISNNSSVQDSYLGRTSDNGSTMGAIHRRVVAEPKRRNGRT